MSLQLVPVTSVRARQFIVEHHRHNRPPVSWLFGVGLEEDGVLVAIGMAGRPISRHQDDGRTMEITRVCSVGNRNANSKVYAALCRAGAALGWRRAITFTLASESGSSLRAAGFRPVGVANATTWARPRRGRQDETLWGERTVPAEDRVRWERFL